MDPVSAIRRVFWHAGERRLRAGWRLLAATAVLFLVVGVVQVLAVVSGLATLDDLVALSVAGGLATLVAVPILARVLDRRTLGDYGLRIDREWWVDCGFGLALGAALQTGIFLVGWLAGWYRVTDTLVADGSFLVAFGTLLGFFLVVGVYEEVLARGWLLTNLAEGLRFGGERAAVAVAVAVSSLLFGLLHAGNPDASAVSVGIISLAGVFLALGYVLTGELAIPVGIHVTWNLFQGPVYGLGVSGLGLGTAVVGTEPVGPAWVTGGGFGPEAGLLGFLAVLVGCGAVVWWCRRYRDARGIHPSVTTPELVSDGGEDG